MILIAILQAYVANTACGSEEYTIGVDDVLHLSVSEHPELSGEVTVEPDGTIILPGTLDIMDAEGLTPAKLREAILQKVSQYILGEVNVTVQVTQYKSRKITIFGSVRSPGTYSYPKIPSLPRILAQVGGWTPNADLTRIMVLSADSQKPTKIINLQQLFEQAHPVWPQLSPGDTVFFPPKRPVEPVEQVSPSTTQTVEKDTSTPTSQTPTEIIIHMLGQISGSFTFETPPSLPQVLAKAGVPPTPGLLKQIQVIQGNGISLPINIEKYIATGDTSLLPQLKSDDLVYIPIEDPKRQKHVILLGAVNSPGEYPIDQPTNLLELLAIAGGLRVDADTEQIQITRETADFIETTTVNLGDTSLDVQPGDKIWVPIKTRSVLNTSFSILRDVTVILGLYRVLTR